MNKFLIAFSALFVVCNAYGNSYGNARSGYGNARSGYGDVRSLATIDGLAYQLQPSLNLGYNNPSVYGIQAGVPIQGYAAQAPQYGLGGLVNSGYDGDVVLGNRALGAQSPAAIVDLNRVLLRRDQVIEGAPLYLPAPIGSGYNIVPAAGQSVRAVANAGAAGQKANIPVIPSAPVRAPGIVVAGGSKSYAPAPAPSYAAAPAPGPVYGGRAYGRAY